MTAVLPSATTATAATATEGDVKNFLSNLRAYLSGLFGDTGLPADARAALGVVAMSATEIATALGYTPANAASVVSKDMGYNTVGSFCFATPSVLDATHTAGSTYAGSGLLAAGVGTANPDATGDPTEGYLTTGSALSGTWRCLGKAYNNNGSVNYNTATLYQRIS